jgi:hypothetical protein
MDAERFDKIAKALAAHRSRRGLVSGLATLMAVGGGAHGLERAGAQDVPGLRDGGGPAIAVSDPECVGQPAIGNKTCGFTPCGTNPDCRCAETASRQTRCVNVDVIPCPSRDECDRNRDCKGGEACIKVGACGCGNRRRNVCVPLCG